jgi:hypothetical protein
MNTKKIRDLLIQSGDRKLSWREEKILDAARQSCPNLAEEESLLQKIQQKLSDGKTESFGPWFAERTMSRIRQITAQEKRPLWMLSGLQPAYRRVLLGAIAVLVVIVAFNISTTSQPNIAEAFGVSQLPIEELADPVSSYILE